MDQNDITYSLYKLYKRISCIRNLVETWSLKIFLIAVYDCLYVSCLQSHSSIDVWQWAMPRNRVREIWRQMPGMMGMVVVVLLVELLIDVRRMMGMLELRQSPRLLLLLLPEQSTANCWSWKDGLKLKGKYINIAYISIQEMHLLHISIHVSEGIYMLCY